MRHSIDILGSCVCRDVFNRSFVNNYSEHFLVNTYVPRIPIPALITRSSDYDFEKLKPDSNGAWQYECFYKMCERNSLNTLAHNRSEILLLDFYTDARLGIAVTEDGNCVANNPFIPRMKSIRSKVKAIYNYAKNPDEYFSLWCRSFDYFILFCRKHTAYKTIVVNGIKGTNVIRTETGYQKNLPDKEIAAINKMWQRMDDYAHEKWGLHVLNFKKEYYMDPNYIYGGVGSEIVHYENAYYRDFFNALLAHAESGKTGPRCGGTAPVNLVKNNRFTENLRYWDFANGSFKLSSFGGENWLTPVALKEGVRGKYIWVWSNPIEINADGRDTYTLMFDYIINDAQSMKTDALFGIRVFKNAVDSSVTEALTYYTVKKEETHTEIGKKYRCVFQFKPEGKYIRIAPHCCDTSKNISFTNICLSKGEQPVYCDWTDESIDFGLLL